ncbi:hypothetical protein LguiB_012972 [Lonicera macranthoides]
MAWIERIFMLGFLLQWKASNKYSPLVTEQLPIRFSLPGILSATNNFDDSKVNPSKNHSRDEPGRANPEFPSFTAMEEGGEGEDDDE